MESPSFLLLLLVFLPHADQQLFAYGQAAPHKLTAQQKADFLISLLDFRSDDGALTAEEVDSIFNGEHEEQMVNIFKAADTNHDGQMDRNELSVFLKVSEAPAELVPLPQQEDDVFLYFLDQNQDGNISEEDIHATFGPENHQKLLELVGRADEDGDGKADQKELVKALSTAQ